MIDNARFVGKVYRALNPLWARDPLSGEGAGRYGGRFNPVGVPALYCSLSPLTALREANQVGDLQPTTLVAYRAAIERVFDGRDDDALRGAGTDAKQLSDPGWREAIREDGESPSQRFARQLMTDDWAGLLVSSYARGSGPDDFNLVLWRWGPTLPFQLVPIDDEGRLTWTV